MTGAKETISLKYRIETMGQAATSLEFDPVDAMSKALESWPKRRKFILREHWRRDSDVKGFYFYGIGCRRWTLTAKDLKKAVKAGKFIDPVTGNHVKGY